MSDSSPSSLPWLSLAAGVVGIAAAAWQERGAGSRAQNPYYVAPVDSGFSAGTHDHLSKTLGRDGRLYELRQERFREQRSSRGGEGHPHDVVGVGTLKQIIGYEEHLPGSTAAVAAFLAHEVRTSGSTARQAARKPKRQVLTPTRLADLEKLKVRLRNVVFEQDEGSERGEKARGLLKKTRERIIAHEAPARAVAARAAKAERKALAEYLGAALAPSSRPQLGRSMEAHRAVEDLAGGRERAFALKRLWDSTQMTGISAALDTEDDPMYKGIGARAEYGRSLKTRFATSARRDGFTPEAVRAFLAVQ